MPTLEFNKNLAAKHYAQEHLKTDPGIQTVFFLPTNSAAQEIRLVEVNHLIADRGDDWLIPIDFDMERGTPHEHRLFVLDVTPSQWERITSETLELPPRWSLSNAIRFDA